MRRPWLVPIAIIIASWSFILLKPLPVHSGVSLNPDGHAVERTTNEMLIDELTIHVRDLERRVAILEQRVVH